MDFPVFYLIPVAVVLVVFFIGYGVSRRAAARYAAPAPSVPDRPEHPQIYEVPGANQQSDHLLGAVQSVVRGRVRFVAFGLLLISVALFGLYILLLTDRDFYVERTALNTAVGAALLVGAVLWGLRLMSYATYRVRLRRTGFELSSIFGTQSCEYRHASFSLDRTLEHIHEAEGYRSAFGGAGNFQFIWQCRIAFRDGRKSVVLKSSRYAGLRNKIGDLLRALEGESAD